MLSEQAEKLKLLARLVVKSNKQHNLTSATSTQQFYNYHIEDCVRALEAAEAALYETVIDCGSGAGLPGLVWATLKPEKSFYTVDSNHKKNRLSKTCYKRA